MKGYYLVMVPAFRGAERDKPGTNIIFSFFFFVGRKVVAFGLVHLSAYTLGSYNLFYRKILVC